MESWFFTTPSKRNPYIKVNKFVMIVLLAIAILTACALSLLLWRISRSCGLLRIIKPEEQIDQAILLTSDSTVDAYIDGVEAESTVGPHVSTMYYYYAAQTRSGIYYYTGDDEGDGLNLTAYIGSSEQLTLPETLVGEKITSMRSDNIHLIENENRTVKSLHIPKGITNVDAGMIGSFRNLEEITVEAEHPSLAAIDGILYDKACETLIACPRNYPVKSIILPDSIIAIGRRSFYKCMERKDIFKSNSADEAWRVICPDGMQRIEEEAFQRSGITEINCGRNLQFIGDRAFEHCDCLRTISIPETLRSIGRKAFYFCHSMPGLELPAHMETIGNEAFGSTMGMSLHLRMQERDMAFYPWGLDETDVTWEDANGQRAYRSDILRVDTTAESIAHMQKLVIPSSVRLVPTELLAGHTALETIEVAPDNPWLCAIDGVLYNKDATELLCCPQSYDFEGWRIPDTVETLGERSLYNCTGLETLTLPDALTTIGSGALLDCVGLTSIQMGAGLKQLQSIALKNCIGLTKLELPQGFLYIAPNVFEGCSNLTEVIVPKSILYIDRNAVYGPETVTFRMQMRESESKLDSLEIVCARIVWEAE